jgi:hypothetical protein
MINFKAAFSFGVNASTRSSPASFLHSVSLGPQTAVALALRSSCSICSRVLLEISSFFESHSSSHSSELESTRKHSSKLDARAAGALGKTSTTRNEASHCRTIFGFFELKAALDSPPVSRCVSKGKRHDSVGSKSVRNNHSAALVLVTGRSWLLLGLPVSKFHALAGRGILFQF